MREVYHSAGRSPRTRGRRDGFTMNTLTSGSIPAHAGETIAAEKITESDKVDPRARGGDRAGRTTATLPSGRSPRTRGRRIAVKQRLWCIGSIPAHAGETM